MIHPSQPPLLRVHKWYRSFQNDALYYTLCLTIIVVNISLFCYGLWFQIHAPVLGISDYLLPIGRGFGLTLELNCALILIPMCHHWMTLLRRWSFFALIVPFSYLHSIHIFISRLIGLGVLVHGGLQIAHFISASIIASPQKVWGPSIRGGISVFTTGVLCTIVLAVMIFFAVKKIRSRLRYEVFFFSHHLYVIFYALLLLHGQRGGHLEFWKWFIGPGFLYVTDRIYRLIVGSCWTRHVSPISLKYYPNSKVTRLEIPRVFNYKPGQYAELRIPQISSLQKHPFTIASSPEDDSMVFFIKSYGRWTSQLAAYAEELADPTELTVFVSGPYGAPAQFSFHFDHLLFIGAGIGATPFVSAMKHAMKLCEEMEPESVQTDHEIAVDWAKHHMQTIDWIDDHSDIELYRSESIDSDLSSVFDVLTPGLNPYQRVHRAVLKLHDRFTSIVVYIAEIWLVLLCILLEALNSIFLNGSGNGITITVFVLLLVLLVFLVVEYCMEIFIHGIRHYFRSFKGFFSLLDVPICGALVVLAIISEVEANINPSIEALMFVSLAVLFCYLFVRLTLRVGSKNVLQLPHGRKVACVRSIDFVWVNSTNGDTEWMLDPLRNLDNHKKTCKSQCASGLTLNHQLYVTREEPASEEPFESVHFHQGRPDWDKIFKETAQQVLSHTQQVGNTVGVFFCGPPVLGEMLRKECILQTIRTRLAGSPLYFIYHQEIF